MNVVGSGTTHVEVLRNALPVSERGKKSFAITLQKWQTVCAMSNFHSSSNAVFAGSNSCPSLNTDTATFEMWPGRSSADEMATQLADTTWDIATLEARIGASWKETRRDEPNRIQDIELKITDHLPTRQQVEDSSWPYHQSPCRLFGSRRRKRNSMGELTMHRSCTSLTRSAEFGFEAHQAELAPDRGPFESRHDYDSRMHGNSNSISIERHRSFDDVDARGMTERQAIPMGAERPGIHRAMSIEEVDLPDQFSSSTKRRRGRRPTPQSATEFVGDLEPVNDNNPQQRDLLKLLRDKQQVSEDDLRLKENRKLLHCIVYQQQMGVCFEDLASHVVEDIENDPEEAFLRPPIPMFLSDD